MARRRPTLVFEYPRIRVRAATGFLGLASLIAQDANERRLQFAPAAGTVVREVELTSTTTVDSSTNVDTVKLRVTLKLAIRKTASSQITIEVQGVLGNLATDFGAIEFAAKTAPAKTPTTSTRPSEVPDSAAANRLAARLIGEFVAEFDATGILAIGGVETAWASPPDESDALLGLLQQQLSPTLITELLRAPFLTLPKEPLTLPGKWTVKDPTGWSSGISLRAEAKETSAGEANVKLEVEPSSPSAPAADITVSATGTATVELATGWVRAGKYESKVVIERGQPATKTTRTVHVEVRDPSAGSR